MDRKKGDLVEAAGLIVGVGSLIASVVIYSLSTRELRQEAAKLREATEREAAKLRRETEKVRHYSRATITWLKEAGLISPRVDPETGEYLDIVGVQKESRWNIEAGPSGASEASESPETATESPESGTAPQEDQERE